MNEDEAFIRAIVDSPGDDTPRLVYADWLDDRSDPHGPYLRAEREAVASGDTARLRELAVGLDPVWVARVSRPPVGVCCDHVRIERRGPIAGPAEIDALEHRLAAIQMGARAQIQNYLVDAEELEHAEQIAASPPCQLPIQLRAFLLNYNGGKPTPGHFAGIQTRRGRAIEVWIDQFLGTVNALNASSIWGSSALDATAAHNWRPDQEDIWEYTLRHLTIAFTEGYAGGIWILLDGEDAGRIEFTGHDQDWDQVTLVAPSLAEFLALLTSKTQPT